VFVGTTGSGKTTLVRQFLGTDPRRERFPSTSTAKTTVADAEVVIDKGAFRAVVTFMPRDQVRDYIEECLSSAVLAAYLGSSDAEIMRRLLNHIDQRFHLAYMLGTGGEADEDLDDLDAEDLDFEDEPPDEDAPAIDMAPTNEVLRGAVAAARTLAERHRARLCEELGATSAEDVHVVDEIFEDNLEHLLREDDEYFEVADKLMDEVERRFELLSPGEVVRTAQGWPRYWRWECNDRAVFLRLRRSARMTHLCSRKVDHPGRCGCGGTDGESVALSPQRGVAWSPQSGLLLSLPSGGRGYADLGHHWGNSIGARQCSRSLD
jgi:hypothetical protein